MEGRVARLEFVAERIGDWWAVSCSGRPLRCVASFGDVLASAEIHAEQLGWTSHVVYVVIDREDVNARPPARKLALVRGGPTIVGAAAQHGPVHSI
jgi:hypothetical protein